MRAEQPFATGTGFEEIDRLDLRALRAADAPAIAAHLKSLSEFDRYCRFFSAMSDDAIERYVAGFDWTRMVAAGLYRRSAAGDRLVGVAELGWDDAAHPDRAEMAVTVDPAYRHRGIAAWLVARVIRDGSTRGVRRMEASWIGGNEPIVKIMRRLDARIWLAGSYWRGEAHLS